MVNVRKLVLSAVVCFMASHFAAVALYGQTGNISGTVTDASGSAVLVGAQVQIEGQGRNISTDASGRYLALGVPAGRARITVSYLGLNASTIEVAVTAGSTATQNFSLSLPSTYVLDHVLNGNGKAPSSIFDQPMSLVASESGVTLSGPLSLASTLTENFLLEYTDGKAGSELGWGRLNASNLQQIMSLHTAYADLMRRTPYLARARGSNLMSRVLKSLEQAANGKPVKGAAGTPATALAVISGHDTNVSNLSGMLGLSWTLPSYQQDDIPPGGALIFSLWQSAGARQYDVRVQFVAQTMDQMHDAKPVSLKDPPSISNVFVPGCSSSKEGFACSWPGFQRAAQAAIDPAFVR